MRVNNQQLTCRTASSSMPSFSGSNDRSNTNSPTSSFTCCCEGGNAAEKFAAAAALAACTRAHAGWAAATSAAAFRRSAPGVNVLVSLKLLILVLSPSSPSCRASSFSTEAARSNRAAASEDNSASSTDDKPTSSSAISDPESNTRPSSAPPEPLFSISDERAPASTLARAGSVAEATSCAPNGARGDVRGDPLQPLVREEEVVDTALEDPSFAPRESATTRTPRPSVSLTSHAPTS
eukprot:scaffold178725_cov25-Tisochrysis_lutea.AAC.3